MTSNKEFLDNLVATDPQALQAWFDAPRADCNQVDSGANIKSDTRTLIIADVNAWIESVVGFSIWASDLREHVVGWLDRQAAITAHANTGLIEKQARAITALQRKVDNLAHDLRESERLREEMREEISIAYDHAHDLLARRDMGLA